MLRPILFFSAAQLVAADKQNGLGCTASVVQGKATVDGSAYAGMNADCSDCDARIVFIKGGEHAEGAKRAV